MPMIRQRARPVPPPPPKNPPLDPCAHRICVPGGAHDVRMMRGTLVPTGGGFDVYEQTGPTPHDYRILGHASGWKKAVALLPERPWSVRRVK